MNPSHTHQTRDTANSNADELNSAPNTDLLFKVILIGDSGMP